MEITMSLKYSPTVFAVADEYQIGVITTVDAVIWIEVGGRRFRDDVNGVLRSSAPIRKIPVPRDVLDEAREYTVCVQDVIVRRDYYSQLDEIHRETYKFRPVRSTSPRAYHIADAHGMTEAPVRAAKHFEAVVGGLDFLILNGDVIDSSASVECFEVIYKICEEITHGEIPVVFSRGNHDTRGAFAELFDSYIPTEQGHSYFTFRLGSIFGFVVDCGEDKNDANIEYGGIIAFHEYRLSETDYISERLAEKKFISDDIKTRIIISHAPFTRKNKSPFDIEEDLYSLWAEKFKSEFIPDLMICGHTHKLATYLPGDESDAFGHPCPIIVASEPTIENKRFSKYTGVGFVFGEDGIRTVTTSESGIVSEGKI